MSESNNGITLVDSSEWAAKKEPTTTSNKRSAKKTVYTRKRLIIYGILFVLWLALMKYASIKGFGQPLFILSVLIFMFINLGKREEGTLSAYSVFNKGAQRLMGTFAPEAIDQQFGGRQRFEEEEKPQACQKESALRNTSLNKMSKMGNQECYCGSGKKFKKCCYWRELKAREDKFKPKPINTMPENYISDSDDSD